VSSGPVVVCVKDGWADGFGSYLDYPCYVYDTSLLDANGNGDVKESPQRWLGGGSGGPFVSQLVSGRILNILRL
jgi:hypothetical protein